MTSFRIRPKFTVSLDKSAELVMADLKNGLNREDNPFDLVEFPGHQILKIKQDKQHYWSPQLSLQFIEEDEQTWVNGRYEPHPSVWTLFVLCYLVVGVSGLFVGIIGFSRLSLGAPATILWALPVLFGAAALLYLVSQLGQKLGAEETFDLHHFVERHLKRNIDIK